MPNKKITYGYKLVNISDKSDPLIMPKKSFSTKFEDGTPFLKSTSIRDLDTDSAREMAVDDIQKELNEIIGGRWLINPTEMRCEMIVAGIKDIASTARMFVDRSLESLWKFEHGIYDVSEYYNAFNNIKDHPYISYGTGTKRIFDAEGILKCLDDLINDNISIKEMVLPPYFLNEDSHHFGEEMEKRLVSRLSLMYSILPRLYLAVVENNFPELRKYMHYANIFPFRCVVRYRYGVDLRNKGLIIDPLGEISVYFEPISKGEDITAIVEKANPCISEEERIELGMKYKNDLKSLGRYSKNNYFRIFASSPTEIIDKLALTKAVYKLLIEDLKWFIDDI